jgi:hypothetical protein
MSNRITAYEHLNTNGWVVVNLFTKKLVELFNIINRESAALRPSFKNDKVHLANQEMLTDLLREQNLMQPILQENELIFQGLLRSDFLFQDKPYLRIARVQCPQDNIGYHKDTMYGGYPEELSVVIPLFDMAATEALKVLSGSHLIPDDEFGYEQTQSETVTKGDSKHKMGFLYAPKKLDPLKIQNMTPVPLKFGQALVFFLSTVHGQEVNEGPAARWSIDTRIVPTNVSLDFSKRPYAYVKV